MTARKVVDLRTAEQIVVRGHIDRWPRERVVEAVAARTKLSLLEANRIAYGWTRDQVAFGLDELYIRDGLKPPELSRSEVFRWERGPVVPNAERQDYLTRLFRTRTDRLGWSRDHSEHEQLVALTLEVLDGLWKPDANGGGELVLRLGRSEVSADNRIS